MTVDTTQEDIVWELGGTKLTVNICPLIELLGEHLTGQLLHFVFLIYTK